MNYDRLYMRMGVLPNRAKMKVQLGLCEFKRRGVGNK
jgi:hypothetical protein